MLLDIVVRTMNRRRIETPYATGSDIMSFGRYRGLPLAEVPLAYWRKVLLFRWFAEQWPALHEYARRRCPNSRTVSIHEHPDD